MNKLLLGSLPWIFYPKIYESIIDNESNFKRFICNYIHTNFLSFLKIYACNINDTYITTIDQSNKLDTTILRFYCNLKEFSENSDIYIPYQDIYVYNDIQYYDKKFYINTIQGIYRLNDSDTLDSKLEKDLLNLESKLLLEGIEYESV